MDMMSTMALPLERIKRINKIWKRFFTKREVKKEFRAAKKVLVLI